MMAYKTSCVLLTINNIVYLEQSRQTVTSTQS